MNDSNHSEISTYIFLAVAAACVFATQVAGRGYGTEIAYLPIVAAAALAKSRNTVVVTGLVGAILTVAAQLINSLNGNPTLTAFSLTVFLLALGVTVAFCTKAQEAIRQLRDSNADLTSRNEEHPLRPKQPWLRPVFTPLSDLGASIAHEIRQPLTAIEIHANAGLRWLEQGGRGEERARASLTQVLKNSRRAHEIINRFSALATNAPAEHSKVALNDVVRDTLSLMEYELVNRNITVSLSLDPHGQVVNGDPIQLQQVLINLVVNALHSMAKAGGQDHVLSIRSWRSNDRGLDTPVVIEVNDTGLGLDEIAVNKLFKGVYTTKPDGTGIGLLISRSIVEAHGGRISATSLPGKGARFTVSLPGDTAAENTSQVIKLAR